MKKFISILAVIFVLFIVLVSQADLDPDTATILFIVCIPIAGIAYISIRARNANDPKKQVGVELIHKKDEGSQITHYSLVLTKRTVNNKSVLRITENIGHTYTYNPAKTVFTGATVGGVTTGGFHTVEAHHTDSVYSTSKYKLQYISDIVAFESPDYYDLEKVRIGDATLLEEAKKHPVIKQYLKGDSIILSKQSKDISQKLEAAGRSGNETLMMNVLAAAAADKGLPKSDAKAILDWLCCK